jgi:hypothetical protein
MRRPLITLTLLFAGIHFGVLLFGSTYAIVNLKYATPVELFWDHVTGFLLFPGSLLFKIFRNGTGRVILGVANSLLWGFILAFCFLRWRSSKTRT